MEAPKKIYLVKDKNTNNLMYYWYNATTDDSRVEYTRTDVIIAKIEQFIRERLRFEDAWHKDGEPTIKDKVIEDFKEFIEED